MSSGSRSLHRKRRVFPRTYSLGCCKSFRMPLLQNCQQERSSPQQRAANSPNQDHFLLQFPVRVKFRAYLIVEVEKLLQRLALRRHNETNNVHEQLRHRVAIEHDCDDSPHGLLLGLVGAFLQLHLQVLQRRLVCRVVLVDQAVCVFEERRHGCWFLAMRYGTSVKGEGGSGAELAQSQSIRGGRADNHTGEELLEQRKNRTIAKSQPPSPILNAWAGLSTIRSLCLLVHLPTQPGREVCG